MEIKTKNDFLINKNYFQKDITSTMSAMSAAETYPPEGENADVEIKRDPKERLAHVEGFDDDKPNFGEMAQKYYQTKEKQMREIKEKWKNYLSLNFKERLDLTRKIRECEEGTYMFGKYLESYDKTGTLKIEQKKKFTDYDFKRDGKKVIYRNLNQYDPYEITFIKRTELFIVFQTREIYFDDKEGIFTNYGMWFEHRMKVRKHLGYFEEYVDYQKRTIMVGDLYEI